MNNSIWKLFLQLLLGISVFCSLSTACISQPQQERSKEDGGIHQTAVKSVSQETWYRLYDWPTQVCDIFFSDEDIWGEEPVLILCNENEDGIVAEGFFSQKRRNVVREVQPRRKSQKAGPTNWQYRYKQTGRVMTKRHLVDPDDINVAAWPDDRKRIEYSTHSEMSWPLYVVKKNPSGTSDAKSGGSQESNEMTSEEKQGVDELVSFACEPLLHSLQLKDSSGSVLWDKLMVRYYREGEIAPPHAFGDGVCGGFEAWLSDGAQPRPFPLPDNTMLVTNYPNTFVIRIRSVDGNSFALPPSLRVIDRDAVNLTKKQMVERYLEEMKKLPPENRMSGIDTMERLYGPDGLYRTLAEHFFVGNHERKGLSK